MRRWLCSLLVISSIVSAQDKKPLPPLRVMSFNIRYGTANDGPNHWKHREQLVLDVFKKHQPDIVGLQEALRFQIDTIRAALPHYEEIGIGRDDGTTKGEYSAILYRKDRFKPIDSGTFWLSDTPKVPGSITWGNDCTRICTWAWFKDQTARKCIAIYNTHWDHVSQTSRMKNAPLILGHMQKANSMHGLVFMGDFNAAEDNPALIRIREQTLSVLSGENKTKQSVHLVDTFRVLYPNAKEVGTAHRFNGTRTRGKIDHVWASDNLKVQQAEIVYDSSQGRYPSDHFPVTATLEYDL